MKRTGKDLLIQVMYFQQVKEVQDLRLIRDRVALQLDPGEAAHRFYVVARNLGLGIREVEPDLREVDAQHSLQQVRVTPGPSLGDHWFNALDDQIPGDHPILLRQKRFPARGLPLAVLANGEDVFCFIGLPSSPIVTTTHIIGDLVHPVRSFPRLSSAASFQDNRKAPEISDHTPAIHVSASVSEDGLLSTRKRRTIPSIASLELHLPL